MHPQWAMDYKKQMQKVPVVKEQVTVIRRLPPAQSAFIPDTVYAPLQGASGYTGTGADNAIQPGKAAGLVHEGEGVLSQNAMQNLLPDEFNTFARVLESGKFPRDQFRSMLGLPPMAGYETGGIVQTQAPTRTAYNPPPMVMPPLAPTIVKTEAPTIGKPAPTTMGRSSLIGNVGSMTPDQLKRMGIDSGPAAKPTFTVGQPDLSSYTAEQLRAMGAASGAASDKASTAAQTAGQVLEQAQGAATQQAGNQTAFYANPPPEVMPTISQPVQTTVQTKQPAAPPPPPPPPPEAMPTITPPPVYSTANTAIKQALQNLIAQMNGMSPADRKIANYYLSNIDSANAANLRVLAHQISSDPNMSDAGKRSAIAGLMRDAGAQRSQTAGQMAIASAERAEQAAQSVFNLGSQQRNYEEITKPAAEQQRDIAGRTFNEITLPQSRQQMAITGQSIAQNEYSLSRQKQNDLITDIKNNLPLSSVMDRIIAANPGMDEKGALDYYKKVQSGQINIDTSQYIVTAINGGKGVSDLMGDQTLINAIAKEYGLDPNDPKVKDQIQTKFNATLQTNKDQLMAGAEKLIEDNHDNGMTRDQTINDQKTRRAMALGMGYDPDDRDPSHQNDISARIGAAWDDYDMPLKNRLAKDFMENYLPDKYKNVPGVQGDIQNMIDDLLTHEVIDPETGTLKAGASVYYPWNEPATYFKYHDWNGKDVSGAYNGSQEISFTGNGTDYAMKNADGSTRKITMDDANAVWNSADMGETKRESYFKMDGTFDMKKFLSENFPKSGTGGAGGSTTITTNVGQLDPTEDPGFTNSTSHVGMEYKSYAKDAAGNSLDKTGYYRYFDKYGNEVTTDLKSSPTFQLIYRQLCEKFNSKKALPAYAEEGSDQLSFDSLWNDGQGWYVDPDNGITNLDSKGTNPMTETAKEYLSGFGTQNVVRDPSTGKTTVKLTGNQTMTESDAHNVSAQWDNINSDLKASGKYFLETTPTVDWDPNQTAWVVGGGNSESAIYKWIGDNMGKLYKAQNGRIYQIKGIDYAEGKDNYTESVILRDVMTGNTINFTKPSGGRAANRPLTAQSYTI